MSEREQEPSRGFKIDDRRRFSSEGELKPEHRQAESAAAQSAQPAGTGGPTTAGPTPDAPRAAPHAHSAGSHEISFATLVLSLSTEALMHLGEMPNPASNQAEQDLPAAQHVIDILGMLEQKTRGNLDPNEEGLLRSILFDLRMKYVETARQGR